jgi:hypothetical protein
MFLLRVVAVSRQFPDPGLDGSAGGVQALVLLGLPVLALGVLAAFYWRTRAEVRRRELEPPLYLLTFITAAAHGESPATPPEADQEDLELDRGRRREVTALRRRGTRLLVALGADVVVIWLATAWYVREVRSMPSELQDGPTFTAVERPPAAAPETLTSDLASNIAPQRDPVPARVDPTPASPAPAPAPPAARVREVSPPPNRTSPPVQERRPVEERPPAPSTARLDTTVTPTVIPPEIPVAVPETVRAAVPETVRTAPPPPAPAPDPVRARADAERALDIAVRHVGRELGARRPVAAAGDAAVMVRFVEWIRSQRPSVTTGELSDIVVEGSSGEAILPVTLRWRDDFGVGKQRTIRLRIAVRRADDWVFSGAELLEKFP